MTAASTWHSPSQMLANGNARVNSSEAKLPPTAKLSGTRGGGGGARRCGCRRQSLAGRRVCPPPARLRASPLSRRLPLKGGVILARLMRASRITPPLRGSRRSRAEWRRLMRWGEDAEAAARGSTQPEGGQRRKHLTLLSTRCYDSAIGPKVLGSEPKGKRVEFPHGRATVISELAGEAGHCCFMQWEGSRLSVLAVSQETCPGIDEARCARERLGRTCTQVFRTTHPGNSPPSAFHLQPCLPMKA